MREQNDEFLSVTGKTNTFYSEVINLTHMAGYSTRHVITDETTGAKAFLAAAVTPGTDTVNLTAHGQKTGAKGQMTTDSADLPDGLALATDYWIIRIDADNFQFASTISNAEAGTPIDLLDAGTGTHTFTPTAISGTATYEGSNGVDRSNPQAPQDDSWEDLSSPAPNAFTSGESSLINEKDIFYKWVRVRVDITAGTVGVVARMNAKGF